MPSKSAPCLGKAWPGKKPQGVVQVDQSLQEQGNAVGLPWGSEEGREVSNTLLLEPFPGLCCILLSQKVQDGEVGMGERLCCPAGLGWGHSYLRASDHCSSTASEPFDASQDTGNWGLEAWNHSYPKRVSQGYVMGPLCATKGHQSTQGSRGLHLGSATSPQPP